ncbi:Aste57867_13442 [Aphanomyces stellatus]|uniref:Aste57867_13442 protein n=1 Tax=Aphanomyces stellatus TaxID=120398 RepID=A0A485KYG5_9STRA|nr:hypothetical protein As57867_013392 [Aphanomyces stellatus]VFT90280.1 Aste57867_13442 [Aphanomyces stellatus]
MWPWTLALAGMSTEARLEAMRSDMDKRKKMCDSLRDERDKWQQKAVEALYVSLEQCEALKDIVRKRDSISSGSPGGASGQSSFMTAWWYGGSESGARERNEIESAVAAHHISYDDIATSAVEVLVSPDLWAALGTQFQRAPNTAAARGFASLVTQMGGSSNFMLRRMGSSASLARLSEESPTNESASTTARGVVPPPGNEVCAKCHGAGFVEVNTADKEDGLERVKLLQKSVENLRTDLRATQTRVIELEMTRDELENGKRALVTRVSELQTTLNDVNAQVAADAKARDEDKAARERNKKDGSSQTDKPPPPNVRPKITLSAAATAAMEASPESPTDAELAQLNRHGLEELLVEKCAMIGELQLVQFTQLDQIHELKTQVQTGGENLVAFHRASENAQQLLRQEITVLRDTITRIQDESSVSMREKQAALQSYLSKMRADLVKPLNLDPMAGADGNDDDVGGPAAAIARLAQTNRDHEEAIAKFVGWTEDDAQVERLATATAEAACRAEAELDNLPLKFVKEDKKADGTRLERASLTTDNVPEELLDTIAIMTDEHEETKASARKLHTLQLGRIVTLSQHLSKVSNEMLLVRRKTGAEIAFWKTECEKLDHQMQCLVTEFNLYKSNHMVEGENALMRSLLNPDQERLWGPDGPEAMAFLEAMRSACGSSSVDPVVPNFLLLGNAMHAMNGGNAAGFQALKVVYDAWRSGGSGNGGGGTPRGGKGKKGRRGTKGVKHGQTTSALIDESSSPSPPKQSKRGSAAPAFPPTKITTRIPITNTLTKHDNDEYNQGDDGAASPSPRRATSQRKSSTRRSSATSPPRSPASNQDGLPGAFVLTAVDERLEPSQMAPLENVPQGPPTSVLVETVPTSPNQGACGYFDDVYGYLLTILVSYPNHDVVTTNETPASAMLASPDGLEMDLPPPDPRMKHHDEDNLVYLKSLAATRSDTTYSLAHAMWALLVMKLRVGHLHARAADMKERRVRFNRPHVVMQTMGELVHHAIQRYDQAMAEVQQRVERLRDRLKHVNQCILHTITHLFPNDTHAAHPCRQPQRHHRYHEGPHHRHRMDILEMGLVDMNHLPPTQQIPTTHFPMHATDQENDHVIPGQHVGVQSPPPTRTFDDGSIDDCDDEYDDDRDDVGRTDGINMSFLVSPFKTDKRFPNRVTKFKYDPRTHEYKLMHVTKLVYPKSAGPTKPTPFALQHKTSVAVVGIRADDDGKLLFSPKDDFDQVEDVMSSSSLTRLQPKPKAVDERRPMNPYRPKSTPSYLTRTAASIRQSPRQQRAFQFDDDVPVKR